MNNKKELTKEIIIANFMALGLDPAVFAADKSSKIHCGQPTEGSSQTLLEIIKISEQIKKHLSDGNVVINPGTNNTVLPKVEDLQYLYHPDHLGSSNYISMLREKRTSIKR